MVSISLWYVLPAIYLLTCGLAMAFRKHGWAIAHGGALAALTVATLGMASSLFVIRIPYARMDAAGLVMETLVGLIGWVIVRFSKRYLEGEAGQDRFVASLLFTFAAVSALVVTHNLLVLALAWTASSLSLHHLLTFHHERLQAQIVAHKKFLASRMAEACLLVALFLLYRGMGTLEVDAIAAYARHTPALSASLHLAAVLIALAAILKSAQLPVHGWLIQVMEAPTPVSALQHAGVVNIGGFVLIRLAALMAAAPLAQAMLVVVGSLTAVLAGLVMMTRISVKVRLAWSTCAQMGFMLMECGLGLYELALLHLVAHSLYKAHAFLSSGEAVLEARRHDLVPAPPALDPTRKVLNRLVALPVALAIVAASAALWRWGVPHFSVSVLALGIVGAGLAPLLWVSTAGQLWPGLRRVLLLTQLYLLWHVAFSRLVPEYGAPSLPLALWVGASFGALYVTQIYLLAYPSGYLATKLFPWAYAGFYLDERFTRLTFRVWPARMSAPAPALMPACPPVAGGHG